MTGLARGLLACGISLGLSGPAPAAPAPSVSAPPPPAFTELHIGPIETDRVGMSLVLAPGTVSKCEGRVRGTLSFYGAPSGAVVDGELAPGPTGCQLPFTVSYEAFPPEALAGARADGLDVRLRGERAEGAARQPVDWKATLPRAAVGLNESMKVTLRRFVRVPNIHLGRMGFSATTVSADVGITVPLRFNLRFLEAHCEVEVNGKKVASGGREKFVLHAGRENRLEIPISMNNGALIAAAGKTVVAGGKAEGRLSGFARLRLPNGDLDFPFEFPIRLKFL